MFSKFFSKKQEAHRNPDKIWSTSEYKFKGLIRIVHDAVAAKEQIALVAHFRKTYDRVEALLQGEGVNVRTFASSIDRYAGRSVFRQPVAGAVALIHINALPEPGGSDDTPEHSDVRLHIVAVEHYPLPALDMRIEELADAMRGPVALEYLGALDEPLFRMFGGERIVGMLSKLGMQPDECIEHAMITSAVKNAQKKLSEAILVDSPGDSMEEWLARNAPHMQQ